MLEMSLLEEAESSHTIPRLFEVHRHFKYSVILEHSSEGLGVRHIVSYPRVAMCATGTLKKSSNKVQKCCLTELQICKNRI